MEPEIKTEICPSCKSEIHELAFFCPVCGKKIREKPLGTGFLSQTGLYAASLLLPPINLIWTIRYLKSADPAAKKVGIISLVIMAAAIIIGIWAAISATEHISKQINQEMGQFQDLGF